MNIVRLMKFIFQQFTKTTHLSVATEKDYLKFIQNNIPELRHILDNQCIYIDKIAHSRSDQLLPICIFHEYLLNGIDFLCYINKIDGVYSTMRKDIVEKF